MGTIREIYGREKYLLGGDDVATLRAYLQQAVGEESLIAEGCQDAYAHLLELLNVPWGRIQTLWSLQLENYAQAVDPNSDYFLIPDSWDVGGGEFDPPWNSVGLEPIAREFPGAIAIPLEQRSTMDEAFRIFKEIRSGRCVNAPSSLLIGGGLMAIAGLGWFLWSKWR